MFGRSPGKSVGLAVGAAKVGANVGASEASVGEALGDNVAFRGDEERFAGMNTGGGDSGCGGLMISNVTIVTSSMLIAIAENIITGVISEPTGLKGFCSALYNTRIRLSVTGRERLNFEILFVYINPAFHPFVCIQNKMSFVSIPGPGSSQGRPYMFMPSKLPGQPGFFPTPKATNQTLGWVTNDRMVMGFHKHKLGDKFWDGAITTNAFVFLLKNPDLLPASVSRHIRYSSRSVREKSVLLTLQQVNYLLAEGSDKVKSVEDVYEAVCPLGVNTTMEPEIALAKPVMNVIVGGNVEGTFNLWGNRHGPLAKAYFVIKRVRIPPKESMSFIMTTTGAEVRFVSAGENGRVVYQLVPWVAELPEDGVEPCRLTQRDVEGFFKVGTIEKPSAFKDMASSNKYDNTKDRISRDMPELLSKSKLVKMFLTIQETSF